MKINFPSLLNTLLTFSEKIAHPLVNQNTGDVSDVQSETSDQHAPDKELAPYEVIMDDFGAPRWLYRSHYRSIFPHMY